MRMHTDLSGSALRDSATPDVKGGVGVDDEGVFTLARLAERGARHWPDATALVDAHARISFAALRDAVSRLSQRLLHAGVAPGDRVVVFGQKDIATLVALLAITQAGGIYVPLDVHQPRARLDFTLADCAPKLVLGDLRFCALACGLPYLTLTCLEQALESVPEPLPLPTVVPSDVAYMLYTSGSTGRPKGVLIEHGSVHAFFIAHNDFAGITAGDRCMNTGPFHYDVSVMDVLLPLYFGASVVLTPELPLASVLLSTLARESITHFYAVGSILGLMTGDGRALDRHDLGALRLLQTGAEVCNPRVVNAWLARLPKLRFLNSYGPTELTVGCVCFAEPRAGLLAEGDVPIGALHAGSVALLLDDDGAMIGDGEGEGELAVGGQQVMRGYHQRPDEERAALFVHAGVRFYRTGDRVRRDARGCLHYVGRRDHEVKVDGCRVHLSEPLRWLTSDPRVQAATVGTVRNRQGRIRVGAAVAMHRSASADDALAVLARIARALPSAFVPVGLLVYDALPRTSTGKTDTRTALLELERRLAEHVAQAVFFAADRDAREVEQSPELAAAE
jgi:amino acid adenylation domain-containing protein